jgi:putative ABC transport system substrate-binding protein
MRRRDFIAGLGGAVTWPLAVQAQQVLPVVGYFNSSSPKLTASTLAAFGRGLAETGFVDGRNVAFEYRWGYNDPSRLPELAADLVHHHVTVIAALNGSFRGCRSSRGLRCVDLGALSGQQKAWQRVGTLQH